MIFVTVGSAAPFDELVAKVDQLAKSGLLKDVTIQLGNGAYKPENAKWFRFKGDLNELYLISDLVIMHTGAGTLFEVVRAGAKAISVPNRKVIENHDLAIKLGQEGYIIFCEDLDQLENKISESSGWEPRRYVGEACRIPEVISEFLLRPSKKDR